MTIDLVLKEGKSNETEQLQKLLNADRPIVIFGAGNLGKKVGNFLSKEKKNVVAFVDNNPNKRGTKFLDKPIASIADLQENIKAEAIWIVAVWSPGHSYVQTKAQWRQSGVKNIFHAGSLMLLYPNELLPYLHFHTPQYFREHQRELEEVYRHLSDEESKRQFIAQLDYRINLNFEAIPEADANNQYFPPGVISLSENEIFLDAGAYDGDTLKEFAQRVNDKFSKYLALEPDSKNYEKLVQNTSSYKSGKVEAFPYAVGQENTKLRFNATGGEGAGLSKIGSEVVECKRIDDHFFQYRPTYLKFDIEGAELGALQGAEKTIKTFSPKLAVCLYHLPDDIWSIPLKVLEFNPAYDLYVRTHSTDGFEFVLYAIPKN